MVTLDYYDDNTVRDNAVFFTFKRIFAIVIASYLSAGFSIYKLCKIKIEGVTDWLDAKKPYKGVGIVRSQGEGCLAVQDCDDDRIYCTFGPKPISGKLYVRFGLRYSNFRFSTPEVTPNI